MPSNTALSEFRRAIRKSNAGKARKRALRKGTTPVFPVHTPEADAAAPAQARGSADE